MGSCWVNVKSGRQACKLEPQAGADPTVLRQNSFLLQEASGFALRPSSDWVKPPQCYYCILSSLGFALKYVICGGQSFLGKMGCLLKILKCIMHSPDLWPSGVWGLVQTSARKTISVFWSLFIPYPSECGERAQ